MRHSFFTVLFFGLAALVMVLNAQYPSEYEDEKRGGGRAMILQKRGGARAFSPDDVLKRGGARAFYDDEKRGGARAFLAEMKRGGARAFEQFEDEKRGGARAFLTDKRAGGRAFGGMMKRGGARAFLDNSKRDEDWVIQPYAGEDLEKRGGGRSFPVKPGRLDD